MDRSAPRITSVMGVARALLSTVEVSETVEVLITEFGWDLTFQALSLLRGEDAMEAFQLAWEHLLVGPMETELRDVHWAMRSWQNES